MVFTQYTTKDGQQTIQFESCGAILTMAQRDEHELT